MTSTLRKCGREGSAHLRDKGSAIERLRQQGILYSWDERRGADVVFGFRYCRFIRPVCVEIEHRSRSHILHNIIRDFRAHAHQVLVLVPNEAIKRSVVDRLMKHLPRDLRDMTAVATMAEFSDTELVRILSRTVSTQEGGPYYE